MIGEEDPLDLALQRLRRACLTAARVPANAIAPQLADHPAQLPVKSEGVAAPPLPISESRGSFGPGLTTDEGRPREVLKVPERQPVIQGSTPSVALSTETPSFGRGRSFREQHDQTIPGEIDHEPEARNGFLGAAIKFMRVMRARVAHIWGGT